MIHYNIVKFCFLSPSPIHFFCYDTCVLQKDLFALTSLSPLDGRYATKLAQFTDYFSEYALIKHRLKVEIEYLLFLSEQKLIEKISKHDQEKIKKILNDFDPKQALQVKKIEEETRHDVKAVEYYLRQKINRLKLPLARFVHIALTSEDVNSLALALMIKESKDTLLIPKLKDLFEQLSNQALQLKNSVFLARTHGQMAIPTTMGKELMVFAMRLYEELQILEKLSIKAKLSGAVGSFSAQQIAFPKINWPKASQEFIKKLGLESDSLSTQIVTAESYSRIFASLERINLIFLDLSQDIWRYISDNYFTQEKAKGQIGSSTMPHKVNPIDFENAEGNLGLANSLLEFFIHKLPISRLQRDLSDSTVKRNIGSAFAYSYLAYDSLSKGLSKIHFNQSKADQELDSHWEVLAEALQVKLRVDGDDKGYEKLKDFSQGKEITQAEFKKFIEALPISESKKHELQKLSPRKYTGLASKLVDRSVTKINSYLKG